MAMPWTARLLALALALLVAVPAAAIEFESSRFRGAGTHGSAMVRAWQQGRSAAKASAFFVANSGRKVWVMTARHVVGHSPVFQYRGITTTKAKLVIASRDFALYEVNFGRGVHYANVRTFTIARRPPKLGQPLALLGYPRGFGGKLMASRNCTLLPRARLLHPSDFTCRDLDRWCRYAEAAGKSRATCLADAKVVRRGGVRLCASDRPTRLRRAGGRESHTHSTFAMNCAVRLGNSGGPVLLHGYGNGRSVIGMPSAVFARVDGPYPDELGVGVSTFDQSFKSRLSRLGVVVE